MLYTSEICCKYSKTHFLTFIFSVFFLLPNIYSFTDEQRIYIHFCVFHPKHPLDIFQYSGIIVRYFLLRPERDYRQRFLLQFEEPELLPEMPFDIERFSIPINSPSYNEAKSFDSYISSFCVLIVTLELQPPSLLPELVSFFSFSYFPKNSQNSPRWTTCCRCNHTG